jgi:hypothetical protein
LQFRFNDLCFRHAMFSCWFCGSCQPSLAMGCAAFN